MRTVNIRQWLGVGAIATLLAGCSGGFDDNTASIGTGTNTDNIEELSYKVNIGASSEVAETHVGNDTATRAEYDATTQGAEYLWTPGDRAGLYMVPAGTNAAIVENARLTSINTSASRFADFEGEIPRSQIDAINGEGRYEYYSYYPYGAAASASGFPNVAFEIPSTLNLTPDVFPVEYGFMVADPVTGGEGERPITWLEGGRQQFGEHIGFKYRHVFAYLEVYLALNLMSQPVNKVVVTCTDGSPIAGTANIDLRTGEITGFEAGASNTLTVNVGGEGLDIVGGEGGRPRYGRIWIPIDPALSGKQFELDFYSKTDARNVSSTTVSGKPLQAGMKHKAGFITNWLCNFSDMSPRPAGWNGDNVTHRGYSFWRWQVNLESSGFPFSPFSEGFLSFNANDGELETPGINTANALGLTNVNVKVTFTASGNAATGEKHIRHGFTKSGVGGNLTGQSNLTLNSARAYSFTGALSSTTPNIKFKAYTWGLYYVYMQEIKVEYVP